MGKNFGTTNSSTENLFYRYADALASPKKLTIEQLKKYQGFQSISDEIAREIIEGLYKLSIITYKKFRNGN